MLKAARDQVALCLLALVIVGFTVLSGCASLQSGSDAPENMNPAERYLWSGQTEDKCEKGAVVTLYVVNKRAGNVETSLSIRNAFSFQTTAYKNVPRGAIRRGFLVETVQGGPRKPVWVEGGEVECSEATVIVMPGTAFLFGTGPEGVGEEYPK